MIKINPRSIRDLVALKSTGVPVTLTSHPGNASLYKLTLWACGIPEHLWDITCCKADANNWPMHRLENGQANLLVTDELHRKIMGETHQGNRFVTAYQFTADGARLGRAHVKAKQICFPENISSCSRLLLKEGGRVQEMFEYLAHTKRAEVFTRYITPDGRLRPIAESGMRSSDLAPSFMRVLHELDRLLFSDEPVETRGGACYDGVMVPIAGMLAQYWQTGRVDRYDISGPDMIHYATRGEHQTKLSNMLRHLRKWDARFVPENIIIQMFPGTVARVGHINGHVSEEVIRRKIYALRRWSSLEKCEKKELCKIAEDDERKWPAHIDPKAAPYFSQYDLSSHGGILTVDDFWMDMQIDSMRDSLLHANALLRIK